MKIVNLVRALVPLALALTACKPSQDSRFRFTNAVVTAEAQLVNAIHNYEGLSLDDRLKLVKSLLDDTKVKVDVNAKNELDEPLLGDAVHFGDGKYDDIRVVELLVNHGADVNAVSATTHRSPLTKAAEFGKIDVIRLFFQHGLEINNENGTRAIVKAAFMDHKDIVDLFLKRGFQATGQYADALQAPGMKSDETKAAAKLFGAYVDIAKEELYSLIRSHDSVPRNEMLAANLRKIQATCKSINMADAIEGNMHDYFNRPEECSVMGRLGSLAYMHCYGLLHSNSANLSYLQEQINAGAREVRAALNFEKVNFASIQDPKELLAYDKATRAAMLAYTDMLLPRLRAVAQRMGHHAKRNQQLRGQAQACGNRALLGGGVGIGEAVNAIYADQVEQMKGYAAEYAAMEQVRAKIAYQLPALNATEVLKQREAEEAKKAEEEKRKKAEEDARRNRGRR